jgi:type IV secretory pathway VirB10-like protein
MNRPILAVALFAAATAALGAQQASQSSPYQGTSNPPADDTITTSVEPQEKPPAGQPADAQAAVPAQAPVAAQAQQAAPPAPAYSAGYTSNPPANEGTDDGIVQVAPPLPSAGSPMLNERSYAPDPDSDMVHPRPLPPGTLGEGTMIRVELMESLSSAMSEPGQPFRSRVASDVLQGDQVLIPAGAEISGRVAEASSGHPGGHGTLLLRPETVTMPDGSSFRLHAMVTDTPVSRTHVGAEGVISPDSRLKRDGIEYGAVVGGGAATGAMIGGPAGALAGTLIGVGVVTAHLLVSHPQARLDTGTVLILTLTEPTRLVPARTSGN